MKNVLISLVLLCLIGCSSGGKVMTSEKFYDISIGTSAEELEKKVGKPYSIKNLGDGEVQYLYIERLKMGTRTIEERHYLFTLKNGKVTSKKILETNPTPYQENSYDMQTTQNADPLKKSE